MPHRVLILARRQPPRLLFGAGAVILLVTPILSALFQTGVDADGGQLGELWRRRRRHCRMFDRSIIDQHFFLRAVGMLLDRALHCTASGVLAGQRSRTWYRRMCGRRALRKVLDAGAAQRRARSDGHVNDFAPSTARLSMIRRRRWARFRPSIWVWLSLIIHWLPACADLPARPRAGVGADACSTQLRHADYVCGEEVAAEVALAGVNLTRTFILGFLGVTWALPALVDGERGSAGLQRRPLRVALACRDVSPHAAAAPTSKSCRDDVGT